MAFWFGRVWNLCSTFDPIELSDFSLTFGNASPLDLDFELEQGKKRLSDFK